jgi:hypothetical protein
MESVYSSFRWVDEGRSAAASTAVVESSCHVNVNDVDAAVLGGFNRIASDHDERVGVASATSAYRSVRRPPSTLSPAGGTASSASALLIAVWHCLGGGTAVQAASTSERPKSAAPAVRVTSLVPCVSADNWSLATSDVVAPMQPALARRWIWFSASSKAG